MRKKTEMFFAVSFRGGLAAIGVLFAILSMTPLIFDLNIVKNTDALVETMKTDDDIVSSFFLITVGLVFTITVEIVLDIAVMIWNPKRRINFFLLERLAIVVVLVVPSIYFLSVVGDSAGSWDGEVMNALHSSQRITTGIVAFIFLGFSQSLIFTKWKTMFTAFCYGVIIALSPLWVLSGNIGEVSFIATSLLAFFGFVVFCSMGFRYVWYLYTNMSHLPDQELLAASALLCLVVHVVVSVYNVASGAPQYFRRSPYDMAVSNIFTALPAMVCAVIPGRISRVELSTVEKQVALKQGFIRYISHEMRTPLNVANIGIELLEEKLQTAGVSDADTNDLTTHVKASVAISIEILNDILTYEKISSSLMVLEKTLQAPVTFVRNCCALFDRQAISQGIHLLLPRLDSVVATQLEQKMLNVDASKMGQVLRNLLSNALKFTPSEGTITVALSRSDSPTSSTSPVSLAVSPGGWLRVDVVDTGAGIAPENIKKVFNEIIQFDANKLQGGKGSGLGLYISRGIVDLHGGYVSVKSEGLGKGCTFSVELPLQDQVRNERIYSLHDPEDPPAAAPGEHSVLSPNSHPNSGLLTISDSKSSHSFQFLSLSAAIHPIAPSKSADHVASSNSVKSVLNRENITAIGTWESVVEGGEHKKPEKEEVPQVTVSFPGITPPSLVATHALGDAILQVLHNCFCLFSVFQMYVT